jgi:hypothetical protein
MPHQRRRDASNANTANPASSHPTRASISNARGNQRLLSRALLDAMQHALHHDEVHCVRDKQAGDDRPLRIEGLT